MGGVLSSILGWWFGGQERTICMVGLDNAGEQSGSFAWIRIFSERECQELLSHISRFIVKALFCMPCAGKTTILYRLSAGEVVVTQTTVGSNVEHVMYKNTQLQIWDLGGQQSLRPFWATYYKGADAVIMVGNPTGSCDQHALKWITRI